MQTSRAKLGQSPRQKLEYNARISHQAVDVVAYYHENPSSKALASSPQYWPYSRPIRKTHATLDFAVEEYPTSAFRVKKLKKMRGLRLDLMRLQLGCTMISSRTRSHWGCAGTSIGSYATNDVVNHGPLPTSSRSPKEGKQHYCWQPPQVQQCQVVGPLVIRVRTPSSFNRARLSAA